MSMKLFNKTKNNIFHPISKKDFGKDSLEKTLEDWLGANPHLLGDDIMLIGRQVRTEHGIIDLLALDSDGNAIVIELKRGRASREVVGQLNSYLTIVNRWADRELERNANLIPYDREVSNLVKQFKEHFGCSHAPDFNRAQIGIVVAEDFESDFVPQIGGLRFKCHVLQFSNFATDANNEFLLINTLHDSTNYIGLNNISHSSITQEKTTLPEKSEENDWSPEESDRFFGYYKQVEPFLVESIFKPKDGWRYQKDTKPNKKWLYVCFSRWHNNWEGFLFGMEYDELEDKYKFYIGVHTRPRKHGIPLLSELRKNENELQKSLGTNYKFEDSGWVPISEYVPDNNPKAVAAHMTTFRDVLKPYLDKILA